MFYIEYKDKQSERTYQRYFRNKPNVTNAYCPHCGNQAMEQQWICHPISEDEIMYTCLHCNTIVKEDDKSFQNANEGWLESITTLEVHETLDRTVIFEDDLGSIARGLKNAKNEKVRILVPNVNLSDTVYKFQDIDNAVISKENVVTLEEAVITPQPRNVRYTPEFLEKAAKAMRDTPLKRKDIRVHDIEMHSQCPACGGMLYEEVNIIFNYCPWCAQALSKDFSDDGE